MQHRKPVLFQRGKNPPPPVAAPNRLRKLLCCEQLLLPQQSKVDKIRVSRKGRIGLVGGVPVARWPNRQDLPVPLSRLIQKVNKPVRLLAKRPNPIGEGREEMCIKIPLARFMENLLLFFAPPSPLSRPHWPKTTICTGVMVTAPYNDAFRL